ncbi:hypothetical protein [Natranaeroarchaeum sulfidigenes]|uniref:DUF6199 domain-containing protein n=1 Tax=Natranaeroarchaeum sulfidigenes TaxID=2784880 RepID=A0A897MWV5_9EURY|nr:hypothetical protein [Natranaeroarchaeum sulfidigenes]QSG03583.1 hypothetical protein AArcS_2387 [Natranaeroarchaeum sulfidigenes]
MVPLQTAFVAVHPVEFLLAPLLLLVGALGGLSIVNPELAFRYENIFQLRDVELSGFGVALQVLGGVLALLVAGPYLYLQDIPFGVLSAVTFYGSALVVMYVHRPSKR